MCAGLIFHVWRIFLLQVDYAPTVIWQFIYFDFLIFLNVITFSFLDLLTRLFVSGEEDFAPVIA